ncbi:MAG: hypothetical protein BWY82_02177 [Verrucomicrobia bacterium ADurb.Bin474]|nr:MAG: hypothetical protein BWY82_02177 [Verrucomicrobia bacterium ADurb.Bin474]
MGLCLQQGRSLHKLPDLPVSIEKIRWTRPLNHPILHRSAARPHEKEQTPFALRRNFMPRLVRNLAHYPESSITRLDYLTFRTVAFPFDGRIQKPFRFQQVFIVTGNQFNFRTQYVIEPEEKTTVARMRLSTDRV